MHENEYLPERPPVWADDRAEMRYSAANDDPSNPDPRFGE